jgi:nitroimidazol reductase NimA-like FMN-containing flavoprotein (pyridoxamine 5'-phosphate oxidase superfamily)
MSNECAAPTQVLTRDECLRHLADGSVGRVSVSSKAMPAVLPVRYSLVDDRILFWADPHDHPAAIADGTVIGFQADDIDPVLHEGWSVMVVGRASHVRQPEAVAALEEGTPRGWAAASGPLVALSLDLVEGRRLFGHEIPEVRR